MELCYPACMHDLLRGITPKIALGDAYDADALLRRRKETLQRSGHALTAFVFRYYFAVGVRI